MLNFSACCFLCRSPGSIINKSEITTNFSPFGDSLPSIMRFIMWCYRPVRSSLCHDYRVSYLLIPTPPTSPVTIATFPAAAPNQPINSYTKPLWTASMSVLPNGPAQSFSVIGNHVPNPALLLTENITWVELEITQADIATTGLKQGTVKKEKLNLSPGIINCKVKQL